jgi:hypothetical protein
MLWIDHVVMLVSDLDAAGASLYDRYGLATSPGGRHAGTGTANSIVPLGGAFLELISVVDREEASAHPVARVLPSLVEEGDRLLSWSVTGDDVDGHCRRLGMVPVPVERRRPDGAVVRCRTTMSAEAGASGLPAFISWDTSRDEHPALALAPHRVTPLGISCLELGTDESLLRDWLAAGFDDLPIRLVAGAPGPVALHVATQDGTCVVDRFLTPEPVR